MTRTIQGFILIDAEAAALNNAGKDETVTMDNSVAVKKIRTKKGTFPYVSGQAWRNWWRMTLQGKMNWKLSPVIREEKIAYTESDPVSYPDDDMFGYMRAVKKETLTRISPLKCSFLISVTPEKIVNDFGVMARHEGDPVPYEHQIYSSVLKGIFSIDIEQAGTFYNVNKTGYKNLNDDIVKKCLEAGGQEKNDINFLDKQGNYFKKYVLPKNIRLQRIKDSLKVLGYISGGAKQTSHLTDVTPKLIVLTVLESGNHIFSHLAKDNNGIAVFNIESLKQVIKDYKNDIKGKIYIGRAQGFMDEIELEINKLKDEKIENIEIIYDSPKKIIDTFADSIDTFIED